MAALGWQLNANQYQAVHLAARYDDELEWFDQGHTSAASAIASRLQLHTGTPREWIRVGHALTHLPVIDAAFRANDLSYAKVQILTRFAGPENESALLSLAKACSARRLTVALVRLLSVDEDDETRDQRLHEARTFTHYTDADGMVVIRAVLPPELAKPIVAAVEHLVERIAATPASDEPDPCTTAAESDACADAPNSHSVTTTADPPADSVQGACADGSDRMEANLRELERRWQPVHNDDRAIPSLAQQRADAFAVLFLGRDVSLTTEVVMHVRGDGNTFDDGTPITSGAVGRQLDQAFIRLLIHDAERRPVNASSRRRHPTTRQKRVVMEAHNHECVDCSTTDLIEFDHNPPYQLTRRTITGELEPRCAPCHRARHRTAA